MPAALTDAVLAWSDQGWRELPWRRTRDPWAVLVSELMLQQTQVTRVVPKWQAFIDRWPTAASCAGAGQADVVREWAGLGYNRRALNLHRCAVAVVERHAGQLPDDLDALMALPGIGPYTARAVLAFAFERDVGVLDTNVKRVLTRALGAATQTIADALVPEHRGFTWNQAMLDLGATVCTASRPRCGECPVERLCVWDGVVIPTRKQSRFEGSDRQGRGRLVDALRRQPVPMDKVAEAAGWPPHDAARAEAAADALIKEGFAVVEAGSLTLRRS